MPKSQGHITIRRRPNDAHSPIINSAGNWMFYDDTVGMYIDSGRSATGDDGHSPYVGGNGNWFEYNASSGAYEDTGIQAAGAKGDKGDQGAAGAVRRASEWTGGKTYYAGAAGEAYQDMVVYKGLHYLCRSTHISSSSNAPSASSSIWDAVSDLVFLATKGLFIGTDSSGWIADGGRLYHTSGLIELSSDGTIKTSNGAFSVDKNGNLVATAGQFKGKVEADSGSIGQFQIDSSGWLKADSGDYGVSISPATINLESTDYQSAVGTHTAVFAAHSYPSPYSGIMALLTLVTKVTPISTSIDYSTANKSNVALRVSASGAKLAGYGTYGTTGGGNFALWCDAGMFAGLRPHLRVATGTAVRLTNTDHTVVVNNSSSCTITLPQTPEVGQEFEIWHTSTTTVNIQSYNASVRKYIMGSDATYAYTFSSTKREVLKLKYVHGLYKASSSENGMWLIMYYGTA